MAINTTPASTVITAIRAIRSLERSATEARSVGNIERAAQYELAAAEIRAELNA